MSTSEPPIPLCLLIADQVYQDRESGNNIIAGTFNTVNVSQLPFQHPSFSVFFQVTNVTRPVELRLCIEYAADGNMIFDLGGPISANTPMDVISKGIRLAGLPFEKAGKYWVQLRSEGAILIQAPLHVNIAKQDQRRRRKSPDAGPDPEPDPERHPED
ncbi:MAG: DUF6941 family protein [Phycisphaerales bacterium]